VGAGTWPLVGRRAELDALTNVITDGRASGVVLAGPAGVGKTRLADELLVRAEAAGLVTAKVTATKAISQIPFGALAPLLPNASEDGVSLNAMADALVARAGGRRLALFVDDGHSLDDPAAGLLLQLAQAGSAFVIVTVRTDDAVPEPVTSLWKEGLAERMEVGPLRREDVEELLAAVLAGPVEGAAVRQLWHASRGHPLLLRELLLGAIDAGQFVEDRGLWCLRGKLPLTLRLAELVESRLTALAEVDRIALELLAFGEPLGLSFLERLQPAANLEGLERRGVLGIHRAERRWEVRLAHPLYAEFLRTRMPVLRARIVRRQLADAIEALGARRREDLLRVTTWRLDGGGDADPALMLAAARQALQVDDLVLAERLAQASRNAGGGLNALQVLGEVADGLGRHHECESLLSVVDLSDATDEQRFEVATARSRNLFWGLGRHAEAAAVDLEAEAVVADPDLRDTITAQRATFDLLAGHPREALEAVREMLDRESGRAVVEAAIVAGPALAVLGRSDEALAAATKGLEAHGRSGKPTNPGIHVVTIAVALAEGGRLHEAWEVAEAGYAAALDQRSTEGQAWFTLMMGRVALFQGRMTTAARWFTEAASHYRQRVEGGPQRWALAGVLLARAAQSDVGGAEWAAAELAAVEPTPFRMMESELLRARAWLNVVRGGMQEAVVHLWAASELAADGEQRALEASALHDLARLGESKAVADRLSTVAASCDGPMAPAQALHARGLALSDAAALEDVAGQFEAIGARLYAAEALASASGYWRSSGHGRAASGADRRGRVLLAQCEGARTPALAVADVPDPLSKREREVALQAARNVPSKEIGDRLHVSVRTVENHLQRIYTKLGITSRAELDDALGP
jgi:DNA-binding CsgD family transcriptional regulator